MVQKCWPLPKFQLPVRKQATLGPRAFGSAFQESGPGLKVYTRPLHHYITGVRSLHCMGLWAGMKELQVSNAASASDSLSDLQDLHPCGPWFFSSVRWSGRGQSSNSEVHTAWVLSSISQVCLCTSSLTTLNILSNVLRLYKTENNLKYGQHCQKPIGRPIPLVFPFWALSCSPRPPHP